MDKMIGYGKQTISEEDIAAVVNVLRSNTLTQGPKQTEFEDLVSKKVNVNYSVAVNSATSALHLACLALKINPGDWVWTSSISFVASANCALYCGARVDFVDIDKETALMSVEKLEYKLEQAAKTGKLPKIVIPVHLAGTSCDMKSIKKLS